MHKFILHNPLFEGLEGNLLKIGFNKNVPCITRTKTSPIGQISNIRRDL